MFSKDTYIQRRQELKKLVKSGVVLIFGNNNSPCNFPNNGYYPFRQDSSFLYYFGQQRDGLVGVIDIDNDIETLIGDDIDIEDIVWYGSVESVHDLAEQVGIHNTAPMKSLKTICNDAMSKKRKIHFLPPYRYDIKLQIFDLLGIHPNQQKEEASMELIQAVVKMRSTKTPEEIEELERAAVIGYKMHTRRDREVCGRSGRWHRQLLRCNGKFPDHLHPARRDHARQSIDERIGGWQTGTLRCRC